VEGLVEELESRISGMLPKMATSEAFPEVEDLTKRLIKAGETAWRTISYTHSVCHLFEKYGRSGSSYLYSAALLPAAGELVDFTLRKALKGRDFGCVDRIVHPIMDLNLAYLEDCQEGFTFKPEILTFEEFIQRFSLSGECSYSPELIDFCKSKSIGEFFPKFVEALRAEKGLRAIANPNEILPGIFIDVDDTLVNYDHYDKENDIDVFKRLALTQEYALRKLQEGTPVVIFTGDDPNAAIEHLKLAGVDERLLEVKSKKEYIGRTLEICVDDTAPAIQGFRAKMHYESGKIAWDTEYPESK